MFFDYYLYRHTSGYIISLVLNELPHLEWGKSAKRIPIQNKRCHDCIIESYSIYYVAAQLSRYYKIIAKKKTPL